MSFRSFFAAILKIVCLAEEMCLFCQRTSDGDIIILSLGKLDEHMKQKEDSYLFTSSTAAPFFDVRSVTTMMAANKVGMAPITESASLQAATMVIRHHLSRHTGPIW